MGKLNLRMSQCRTMNNQNVYKRILTKIITSLANSVIDRSE